MSSIDTEFNNYFHKELNSITSDNDSIPGTKLSFIKYFTSLNKLYIKKSVLSRIQNNVSIIDKSIIEYCASQVGTAGGYISYDPVIWQNVTHLKRGEELKIKSGIGTFYNKFRPEMVINGKTIYTDEEGKLSYSLKVSDSLGKHTIPIKIVFYTWDSIKDSTTLYVEYFIDN